MSIEADIAMARSKAFSQDRHDHYAKKPKHILIVDCVYLDAERDRYVSLQREAEKRIAELERQNASLRVRAQSLRFSVGKLTEALVSSSDASLVDVK